jgi:arylsulfatase A-like enzyme
MAEMVDFYPTLSQLAGLPEPKSTSGVSLVPALRDPATIVRDTALTQYENGYSLRTQKFRYTSWGENGAEGVELYDRSNDPAEMNNVADDPAYADDAERLAGQLGERIRAANTLPKGSRRVKVEFNRHLNAKK